MWNKADHTGQSHKSVSTAISSSISAACLGRMQAACVCGLLETKKCMLSRNILFCRNICYCISLVKPQKIICLHLQLSLCSHPNHSTCLLQLHHLSYFSCTTSPASFKPSLLHLILISIISAWINLSVKISVHLIYPSSTLCIPSRANIVTAWLQSQRDAGWSQEWLNVTKLWK